MPLLLVLAFLLGVSAPPDTDEASPLPPTTSDALTPPKGDEPPTVDKPTIDEPTIDEPTVDEPTVDEPPTRPPTVVRPPPSVTPVPTDPTPIVIALPSAPPIVLPPLFLPVVVVNEPAAEPRGPDLSFLDSEDPPSDTELDAMAPAPRVAEGERPLIVVKALVGLIVLLALAYLGGHPRVRHIEQMLGISRVVAAGFPFLALGMLASSESLDILSDDVLDHLRPVLHLALGWIGLTIGIRIEFGKLGSLPRGTSSIVGIGTGLPFLMIVAGCGTVLALQRGFTGASMFDVTIVRDALIFGAAGAMAADTETLRYGARRASEDARNRLVALASLDELAGLIGLAFLNAYFRPTGAMVTWQLPNTAWLFVTFGLAFVVGFVVYAIVRLPNTNTEAVALLLGSVGFTAGMASELHLSPLVVCFVVGVLLANFPGDYKVRLQDILGRLEMPIYLVFLIVAGAMWRPTAIGVVIMFVFLVARFAGRWLGGRIVYRSVDVALPVDARRSLVFAPMGTLPIAIAVNAALFYPDGPVPSFLTAAIGGAIITEFFLQIFWRWQDQQIREPG